MNYRTLAIVISLLFVSYSCNIRKENTYDNDKLVSKYKLIKHKHTNKTIVHEYYSNKKLRSKKKYISSNGFGSFLIAAKVIEYDKKGKVINRARFETGKDNRSVEKNQIITYTAERKTDTLFLKSITDFQNKSGIYTRSFKFPCNVHE